MDDMVACCVEGRWEYHRPLGIESRDYDGLVYLGDGLLNLLAHFTVPPECGMAFLADDGGIVRLTAGEVYGENGTGDVPGASDVYIGTWRFGAKPEVPREHWDWDDDYDLVPFVDIGHYAGKLYSIDVPGGMLYTHRMEDDESLDTLLPRGHWV